MNAQTLSDSRTAFTVQSAGYDVNDVNNPVLPSWRKRVYTFTERWLKPGSDILELNSGTGIDAIYFSSRGHRVHATDGAAGMVEEMKNKVIARRLSHMITVQQISFEQMPEIKSQYDVVFSNFGGLNCLSDLTVVAAHLTRLLKPGGYVVWVIMPPLCPWEWGWVFKGKFSDAFRRLRTDGTIAYVEGHRFKAYYHSVSKIKKALGQSFRLVGLEGLGSISPPPFATRFTASHKVLHKVLTAAEKSVCSIPPFNRWADHIMVSFQYKP
ncbi:MAG: class I SAM-dependent methyltransferase [Bacteroidetes bacterium]|nr:class I SAM-dependent methyltransferase [Bacteroidota bacterium]